MNVDQEGDSVSSSGIKKTLANPVNSITEKEQLLQSIEGGNDDTLDESSCATLSKHDGSLSVSQTSGKKRKRNRRRKNKRRDAVEGEESGRDTSVVITTCDDAALPSQDTLSRTASRTYSSSSQVNSSRLTLVGAIGSAGHLKVNDPLEGNSVSSKDIAALPVAEPSQSLHNVDISDGNSANSYVNEKLESNSVELQSAPSTTKSNKSKRVRKRKKGRLLEDSLQLEKSEASATPSSSLTCSTNGSVATEDEADEIASLHEYSPRSNHSHASEKDVNMARPTTPYALYPETEPFSFKEGASVVNPVSPTQSPEGADPKDEVPKKSISEVYRETLGKLGELTPGNERGSNEHVLPETEVRKSTKFEQLLKYFEDVPESINQTHMEIRPAAEIGSEPLEAASDDKTAFKTSWDEKNSPAEAVETEGRSVSLDESHQDGPMVLEAIPGEPTNEIPASQLQKDQEEEITKPHGTLFEGKDVPDVETQTDDSNDEEVNDQGEAALPDSDFRNVGLGGHVLEFGYLVDSTRNFHENDHESTDFNSIDNSLSELAELHQQEHVKSVERLLVEDSGDEISQQSSILESEEHEVSKGDPSVTADFIEAHHLPESRADNSGIAFEEYVPTALNITFIVGEQEGMIDTSDIENTSGNNLYTTPKDTEDLQAGDSHCEDSLDALEISKSSVVSMEKKQVAFKLDVDVIPASTESFIEAYKEDNREKCSIDNVQLDVSDGYDRQLDSEALQESQEMVNKGDEAIAEPVSQEAEAIVQEAEVEAIAQEAEAVLHEASEPHQNLEPERAIEEASDLIKNLEAEPVPQEAESIPQEVEPLEAGLVNDERSKLSDTIGTTRSNDSLGFQTPSMNTQVEKAQISEDGSIVHQLPIPTLSQVEQKLQVSSSKESHTEHCSLNPVSSEQSSHESQQCLMQAENITASVELQPVQSFSPEESVTKGDGASPALDDSDESESEIESSESTIVSRYQVGRNELSHDTETLSNGNASSFLETFKLGDNVDENNNLLPGPDDLEEVPLWTNLQTATSCPDPEPAVPAEPLMDKEAAANETISNSSAFQSVLEQRTSDNMIVNDNFFKIPEDSDFDPIEAEARRLAYEMSIAVQDYTNKMGGMFMTSDPNEYTNDVVDIVNSFEEFPPMDLNCIPRGVFRNFENVPEFNNQNNNSATKENKIQDSYHGKDFCNVEETGEAEGKDYETESVASEFQPAASKGSNFYENRPDICQELSRTCQNCAFEANMATEETNAPTVHEAVTSVTGYDTGVNLFDSLQGDDLLESQDEAGEDSGKECSSETHTKTEVTSSACEPELSHKSQGRRKHMKKADEAGLESVDGDMVAEKDTIIPGNEASGRPGTVTDNTDTVGDGTSLLKQASSTTSLEKVGVECGKSEPETIDNLNPHVTEVTTELSTTNQVNTPEEVATPSSKSSKSRRSRRKKKRSHSEKSQNSEASFTESCSLAYSTSSSVATEDEVDDLMESSLQEDTERAKADSSNDVDRLTRPATPDLLPKAHGYFQLQEDAASSISDGEGMGESLSCSADLVAESSIQDLLQEAARYSRPPDVAGDHCSLEQPAYVMQTAEEEVTWKADENEIGEDVKPAESDTEALDENSTSEMTINDFKATLKASSPKEDSANEEGGESEASSITDAVSDASEEVLNFQDYYTENVSTIVLQEIVGAVCENEANSKEESVNNNDGKAYTSNVVDMRSYQKYFNTEAARWGNLCQVDLTANEPVYMDRFNENPSLPDPGNDTTDDENDLSRFNDSKDTIICTQLSQDSFSDEEERSAGAEVGESEFVTHIIETNQEYRIAPSSELTEETGMLKEHADGKQSECLGAIVCSMTDSVLEGGELQKSDATIRSSSAKSFKHSKVTPVIFSDTDDDMEDPLESSEGNDNVSAVDPAFEEPSLKSSEVAQDSMIAKSSVKVIYKVEPDSYPCALESLMLVDPVTGLVEGPFLSSPNSQAPVEKFISEDPSLGEFWEENGENEYSAHDSDGLAEGNQQQNYEQNCYWCTYQRNPMFQGPYSTSILQTKGVEALIDQEFFHDRFKDLEQSRIESHVEDITATDVTEANEEDHEDYQLEVSQTQSTGSVGYSLNVPNPSSENHMVDGSKDQPEINMCSVARLALLKREHPHAVSYAVETIESVLSSAQYLIQDTDTKPSSGDPSNWTMSANECEVDVVSVPGLEAHACSNPENFNLPDNYQDSEPDDVSYSVEETGVLPERASECVPAEAETQDDMDYASSQSNESNQETSRISRPSSAASMVSSEVEQSGALLCQKSGEYLPEDRPAGQEIQTVVNQLLASKEIELHAPSASVESGSDSVAIFDQDGNIIVIDALCSCSSSDLAGNKSDISQQITSKPLPETIVVEDIDQILPDTKSSANGSIQGSDKVSNGSAAVSVCEKPSFIRAIFHCFGKRNRIKSNNHDKGLKKTEPPRPKLASKRKSFTLARSKKVGIDED